MGHMASKEQVFLHGQLAHTHCYNINLYCNLENGEYVLDCHNNTFVGIRSLKSGDNTLYAEFFANGMSIN